MKVHDDERECNDDDGEPEPAVGRRAVPYRARSNGRTRPRRLSRQRPRNLVHGRHTHKLNARYGEVCCKVEVEPRAPAGVQRVQTQNSRHPLSAVAAVAVAQRANVRTINAPWTRRRFHFHDVGVTAVVDDVRVSGRRRGHGCRCQERCLRRVVAVAVATRIVHGLRVLL